MFKFNKKIILILLPFLIFACSSSPDVMDTAIDKQKEMDVKYKQAQDESKAKADADAKAKSDFLLPYTTIQLPIDEVVV